MTIAAHKHIVGDVLVFQTNRWYTEQGQRIAASMTNDGDLAFVDIDRMISGLIRSDMVRDDDMTLSERSVMWAYDYGNFTEYWANVHLMDDTEWELLRAQALTAPAAKR